MRLLRPSAVAPAITVRNQVMWGLLTVTRLASCWSVPCHMCKKRWKNESWPESVPTFPNQVVAASGKPLWDVKWLVHCKSFPGHSRRELGHRWWWTRREWVWLLTSALKRQDHSKAHFLFCYTSSSTQSLFLGALKSSSVLDANQSWAKVEFQHTAIGPALYLNYLCSTPYFKMKLYFFWLLQIFEIFFLT